MKQVNENGFWRIENNPISQVGVFPYLGKNISEELEPNKIYFVYRPASELFAPETLESFNSTPLPLVDEHEMLGDGATPAEHKGIHGVISNVRQDGKLLVGDISIYSETMKDEINRGKKDLSMGYYCEYDLEEGDYEGQHYDAVQRNLRGNHVALVDQGRCGHAVRVYDHFSIEEQQATQDVADQDTTREDGNKNTANDSGYIASLKGADSVSKEENKMAEELKARDGDLVIKHDDEEEEVKDASVDKRELIREIGAIAGQAGMSDELVRTLMEKAEQLAYNGSEQSEATDACGKDEDAEMEEEFKETEDSDDEEKDDEKISKLVEKKVEDALNGIDFLALVEAKKNMLEKVRPLVGDFDASKMTNNDIAKYACDKLNIKATSDSANDVLDCYLNMKGNTKIYSTVDSMDDSADDIIARYKRGE